MHKELETSPIFLEKASRLHERVVKIQNNIRRIYPEAEFCLAPGDKDDFADDLLEMYTFTRNRSFWGPIEAAERDLKSLEDDEGVVLTIIPLELSDME